MGTSHEGNGVRIRISGVGAEIPEHVLTSTEVEERAGLRRLGFEAGWLERLTGVRERHFAPPNVLPSELATLAARRALDDAGVTAADVDTVIFAGITRDFLEPAVANLVAENVGAHGARVFDLINACNGVMDGIDVADSLIRSGKARRVLIATGERASWGINWTPATPEEVLRSVAGLVVGDGGGAVVVEASDDPGRGILAREFRSDGTQWRHAIGGRLLPTEGPAPHFDAHFMCNGRDLFTAGANLLFPTMYEVMVRTGWGPRDLDLILAHQPSRRFIDDATVLLGSMGEKHVRKVWNTIERFGNISTCSLPTAMSEARAAGRLVPGTKVLMLAPASGVSAAAMTMVW
jgi:3-oxoacyl-(acyl-carrier-protein) synthase III